MGVKKTKKKAVKKGKKKIDTLIDNEEVDSSAASTPVKIEDDIKDDERDELINNKKKQIKLMDSSLNENTSKEASQEVLNDPEKSNWDIAADTLLFRCIAHNKPAGLHKHFRMANICYLYNRNNSRPKTNVEIWERLNELYDMQAVDEIELKEPDEWSTVNTDRLDLTKWQEFELPVEFNELKERKIKESKNSI